MKILMLSSTFPYPPTKGRRQLRTFHLLKYLSNHHYVTLLTHHSDRVNHEEIKALESQVGKLIIFPQEEVSPSEGIIEKAKRLGTFIQQGTPPEILKTYSPAIASWVKEAIQAKQFELITCEDSTDEIYINDRWHEKLGIVLNVHSSEYGKYKQQLETGDSENELKDQINLGLLRRYEQSYLSKFNYIVTVTNKDKRLLKELAPESQIKVIPNGVDLAQFPRRVTNQGGQRIVFVGNMDRPANINAARFLALEIFPAVRERYPEATLELVGAKPTAEVQELDALEGIKVTGAVTSVVEYLHWATVCVLPMRQGFGLKNRTLEAMAMGIPVVGSDRALSGLEVDGASIPLRAMRANSLEEYVYAIGRLFAEPKLREKISENSRSFVEQEYTWEQIGKRYEKVLLDTFKKEGTAGVEPDACFYIQNYQRMISRRRLHSDDPPPDLAIECDVTSKTTLDAYLAIKVPELWVYDSGQLTIYILRNENYVKSDVSPTFPHIPLKQIIPNAIERSWQVGSLQALEELEATFNI